ELDDRLGGGRVDRGHLGRSEDRDHGASVRPRRHRSRRPGPSLAAPRRRPPSGWVTNLEPLEAVLPRGVAGGGAAGEGHGGTPVAGHGGEQGAGSVAELDGDLVAVAGPGPGLEEGEAALAELEPGEHLGGLDERRVAAAAPAVGGGERAAGVAAQDGAGPPR